MRPCVLLQAILLPIGCARSPSPVATADPAATSESSVLPPRPQPSSSPRHVGSEPSPVLSPPSASAPPPVPVGAAVPELLDPTGEPLPQTDELPDPSSPSLRRRLELLVQAIREDQPSLALPAFFPLVAYAQVKAIAKPERDWQQRLVAAFERNIHEYHAALGQGAEQVSLLGLEIPEHGVKFMKPHTEGNRLGYHRVLRSQLRLQRPDGTQTTLEITSMISWRGEWYVVHLYGFK